MPNLNDILQSAQGGQLIGNLAQQFGISPDQAQAALKALLPGLSAGLQNQADTGNLGDVLSHVANPANQAAFNNAGTAKTDATTKAGGDVLSQIFGDENITQQIANHAAQHTGLSPGLIQAILPVAASVLMGGLFHSASNQGLGGILGQLAGQSGLGGGPAPNVPAPQQSTGGLGGLLGSVVGGLFGGKQPAGASLDPTTVEASLGSLISMFGHGTEVSPGQKSGLDEILGQLTSARR
jgi:hypothetical protein